MVALRSAGHLRSSTVTAPFMTDLQGENQLTKRRLLLCRLYCIEFYSCTYKVQL